MIFNNCRELIQGYFIFIQKNGIGGDDHVSKGKVIKLMNATPKVLSTQLHY